MNDETKTTGRPKADERAGLSRLCAKCGSEVVRPGVLRPVPLCAKHYFEARRRAAGVLPRKHATPTDATLAVLLVEVARMLRSGMPNDALATKCDDAVAALARAYPSVRRSVALSKEGARNG